MNQKHENGDQFVDEYATRKGKKRDRLGRSAKARKKREAGRLAKEGRIYGNP